MTYYDEIQKLSDSLSSTYKQCYHSILGEEFIALKQSIESSFAPLIANQKILVTNELWTTMADNLYEMMRGLISSETVFFENMQQMLESTNHMKEKIISNETFYNYASIVRNFEELGYSLFDLVSQLYEKEDDEDDEEFASNQAIIEALQEQEDDPKGFQERFADWSDKKKRKYSIILGILFFIWANVFAPYFQDTVGKPVAAYVVSKVKELPQKCGKVIDEIKDGEKAVITEDVPYYYKVKYIDENGQEREGYVAKKNLEIIEEE